MNQIVLPDPFAPLLQFVQSINQSLEEAQKKMRQQFLLHQQQLQSDIEDAVTTSDAIREIIRHSEQNEVEMSGVLFFDPDTQQVTDVFLDSVGDLTSVDLSITRVPADSDLQTFSFHSHPRFGITNFSDADLSIAKSRVWERGHCIITGSAPTGFQANCMEL